MKTNRPRARAIIDAAVESQSAAARLEATVRRPPRSRNFVAVFSGPEPGEQIARSTGLSDEAAARELAKEWEQKARRQREARKADAQGHRQQPRGTFGLSQREVAVILRISERAVRAIEKRAIRKLRKHPVLGRIWREYHESLPSAMVGSAMTPERINGSEATALLGLARTPLEARVLRKILALVRQGAPDP